MKLLSLDPDQSVHDLPELRASIGHIIREEPDFASKQTFQASTSTHIRKRGSTLRHQASNVPSVSPQIYRHSHEQDVPAISVRESSTFCLKPIITLFSHEYRHEFGAACIFTPTSRPSSSPRRGRSASALPPATDSCSPNPDQWEGKVSALLQVFVVHYE